MNKERVKSLQEKMGWDKKQAEKFLLASDRREQNMDSAKYRQEKKGAEKEKQKDEEAEGYNSQQYLERRTLDADRALLEAMQDGKGWACELFYKLMKRLTDKAELEIKFGLTADEVSRRNLQAERELREGGFGVAEVPDERPLLSQKIRENQGQQEGDNTG